MSKEFETMVITKLEDIGSRLSSIEEKIDEATSFAGSVLGEDGVMPSDGLEAIKSTFSSLLNPQSFGGDPLGEAGAGQSSQESMTDLVSSLKSFQDRLASVRDAVADLPREDVEEK